MTAVYPPALPGATLALLARFAALVRTHAASLDLVSPGDLPRLEERHLADSLRVLDAIDSSPPGPIADVGSGAGFPGIPIALARPDRVLHLIEPRRRRAAFLEEVVRRLELGCEVINAPVEDVARRSGPTYAAAVARALAPPTEAFRMILPLVAEGGTAAVFVGAGDKPPPGAGMSSPGIATIRKTAPK